MIELENLSSIGFGSYRVSIDSQEHSDALCHALRSGCNLVDTSPNYENNRSEALIGKVMLEHPDLDVFVITKAGYIQGDNLAVMAELNRDGLACDDLISFSDNYKYSIHPDFLRCQIDLSRRRLQRTWIDGFLLHNPEHYFDQEAVTTNQDEYYARIQCAFECLEEFAAAEIIRYYGVSSNTFPLSTELETATDLWRLLKIAETVSRNHHFKLIEFPFNLLETGANKPCHGGVSLIELAKAHGLVTFSNRPLNAKAPGGTIRLATYEQDTQDLDEIKDSQIFAEFVELITRQLRRMDCTDDPMAFTVVRFLRDSWTGIASPDLVIQVFQEQLYPFLHRLYEGGIPAEDAAAFAKLRRYSWLYSKRSMTERTLQLRRDLVEQGVIPRDDPTPMALLACQYCLDAGIAHVLVGMRQIGYVDSLKMLFQATAASNRSCLTRS
jgi:aryl-alcohol dehydrogenase-like predicted oxidoreductase